MKIVSLLPSATELICKLGLQDQLVGVSHECDFPAAVSSLPKVTKTLIGRNISSAEIDAQVREQLKTESSLYSINVDEITRLQPDLIVTQALCSVCAVAESEVRAVVGQLKSAPRIINLEPTTLADVFKLLKSLGEACNCREVAETVVSELSDRVAHVAQRTERNIEKNDRPRTAFFEWIDPIFGPGHWNPEIINLAGGIDSLGRAGEPSRRLDWIDVLKAQPDVLFIACCGYPLKRALQDMTILESHDDWNTLPCVRNNQIYLSDGNAYFARPGPRLVDSLEILANALHPSIHPIPTDIPAAFRY